MVCEFRLVVVDDRKMCILLLHIQKALSVAIEQSNASHRFFIDLLILEASDANAEILDLLILCLLNVTEIA